MAELHIDLGEEHLAMLDAIRTETGKARSRTATELLIAVLEDDAAQHNASAPSPDHRVISIHNWLGARGQRRRE